MAPSRRKKAKNAAASRKWNVGELVLAKVKGYPAWPAIVSDPEKCELPYSQKKVLVIFFGTREIAFCNPADLEEFTEEKKITLLGKRYGKASNFGLALSQIIDSFDKLKKQEQVSDNEPFGETDLMVENISGESFTKSVKDEAVPNSVEQRSAGATNCMEAITETVVATSGSDALHDGVMQLDEVRANMTSTENHVYLSRSQAETRKLRNYSNQKMMYSRSSSGFPRVDALISDEGSTADLGCESVGGKLSEDTEDQTELSDRLEFQTSGRAFKKRKADQQRHLHDTISIEFRADLVVSEDEIAKPDRVTHSESGAFNISTQQDGDEHLPLAKRARIRMGTHVGDEGVSRCEVEKLVGLTNSPNVLSDGTLNCILDNGEFIEKDSRRTSPAKQVLETLVHEQEEEPAGLSSCPLNCNADVQTSDTKEDYGHTSISHESPVRKPQPLQSPSINGCIDGESALPLSKRIHRALEAMSANEAESGDGAFSNSPAMDAHDGMCLSSCSLECSELPLRNEPSVNLGLGPMEDYIGVSQASASEFYVGLNMGSSEHHGKTTCVVDCSNPEISKGSSEKVENVENICMASSSLFEIPVENVEDQRSKPKSFEDGEKLSLSGCRTTFSASADNSKIERREEEEAGEGSDLNVAHTNSDSILVKEKAGDALSAGICNLNNILDSSHEDTNKTKEPALSEKDLDSQRSEFVKEESRPASPDSNIVPSETTMNLSTNNDCRYSCSVYSNSDSNLANGQDSIACVSPPNSLLSSSKVESLLSFEGVVGSLTRSKETIGRATRIAIECAKLGFASKVVEILVRSLERESSLPKKVDLFFLVDSITQCSSCLKGDSGIFPSLIQPLLPRLLLAAAPPGLSYYENHRQCLKVLRVWLERKILPEPIIRPHIEELDAFCNLYHSGGSRRIFRNERAFDDPVREMEGILVDEYGSNSSIQFPGFCMPPMLSDADGGSDSDEDGFEAVTPEHNIGNHDGGETTPTKVGKHSHILEDVDGELEMEDVAPSCEFKTASTSDTPGEDHNQMSFKVSDNHYGVPFAYQQFEAPPPLPPPPPSHHTPPSVFTEDMHRSISSGHGTKLPFGYEDYKRKPKESRWEQSYLPRMDTRVSEKVYRYPHEDQDLEQEARHVPSFSNQPTAHLRDRASNGIHQADDTFHERAHQPHSHQNMPHHFSYTQEQRSQSQRDFPPQHHPNRFRTRYAGNGNFHRDFERNRYAPQSGPDEYWGPPSPSTSGHCYDNGSRMDHAPYPPSYPHNKPSLPSNRRRVPPWLMNRMGGPVPVGNRGPNNWKSR